MDFIIYDLIFLVIFIVFLIWFFYTRRKKVDREIGIMFLYRTTFGVKIIDRFSKKYEKVLKVLQYPIIIASYILMTGVVYLVGKSVWIYILYSDQIVNIINAPPIAPLIPYFPRIFGMESFFPPLYTIYFLIAIASVLFSHEFCHGIYMRLYNIRIRSTGVAALGPLFGAFVEQDEEDMRKKSNFNQMVVLGAGTFANVLIGLIFLILLIGFFYVSFVPAGYIFTDYAKGEIPIEAITGFGDESSELMEVYVGEQIYFLDGNLKKQLDMNLTKYIVLDNAPAIKVGLEGVIVSIEDYEITGKESLEAALGKFNPGNQVEIKTLVGEEYKTFTLVLDEHPEDNTKAYLGISNSLLAEGNIVSLLSPQEPSTYYTTKWNGDFAFFIFYLLFWIAFINLAVAFFNMLPVSILDGGRFFELTILSLTKSEKVARIFYKLATYLILFGILLMLLLWFVARF